MIKWGLLIVSFLMEITVPFLQGKTLKEKTKKTKSESKLLYFVNYESHYWRESVWVGWIFHKQDLCLTMHLVGVCLSRRWAQISMKLMQVMNGIYQKMTVNFVPRPIFPHLMSILGGDNQAVHLWDWKTSRDLSLVLIRRECYHHVCN